MQRSDDTITKQTMQSHKNKIQQLNNDNIAKLTPLGGLPNPPYEICSTKFEHQIGRGDDCDYITTSDVMISKKHFKILFERKDSYGEWSFFLQDCSTNGTYVNNELILKDKIEIYSGDHIDLAYKNGSDRISYIFSVNDNDQSSDKNKKMKPTPPTISATKSDDDNLATSMVAKLRCVICQEIIWKAATATPCSHSYCGGCISEWHKRSSKCPLCNTDILQVNKNHTLDSLVEELVASCPEKFSRSAEDIVEQASKNTIKYGCNLSKHGIGDDDDNDDDDEDDDDEDDEDDEEDEDDEDGGGNYAHIPYHASAPPPPPVSFNQQDVVSFISITGCTDAVARRYIIGAAQRRLYPVLDNAVSYFYETGGQLS